MTEEEKKQHDEEYADRIDSIADSAQAEEESRLDAQQEKDYDALKKTLQKNYDALGEIDDHYTSNLPTFLLKDFMDDKFGDHTKKDAKVRLAYFLVNGLQAKLKNASNAAFIAAGKSPMFQDTQSDYEKIKQTNLYQGLENRWSKNKQSTQNAIDLVKTQGIEEQEARNALNRVSRNSRLNSKFGMLNEQQKAYVLKVLSEIGDDIKDSDLETLTTYLIGGAMTGNEVSSDDILTITGLKVAPDVADGIKGLIGNAKDKIPDDFSPETANGQNAGVGGGDKEYGLVMNKNEVKDLQSKADALVQKYIDKEIDETTFDTEYQKLVDIMNSHVGAKTFIGGIKSLKDIKKYVQDEWDAAEARKLLEQEESEKQAKKQAKAEAKAERKEQRQAKKKNK